MIAHLSYVMCDKCGNPAEVADDAPGARAVAKAVGYDRTDDGRDWCKDCRLARIRDDRHDPPASSNQGEGQ